MDLRAETWERAPAFFTAPGFCTEYLTVYLATDLHPAEEMARPDDEDLEVVRMTLPQALDAIDAGEIEDAKSIVAILCALGSFYFSHRHTQSLAFLLAFVAIGAGLIGGVKALSPRVSGGIISIFAVLLGMLGIIVALLSFIL